MQWPTRPLKSCTIRLRSDADSENGPYWFIYQLALNAPALAELKFLRLGIPGSGDIWSSGRYSTIPEYVAKLASLCSQRGIKIIHIWSTVTSSPSINEENGQEFEAEENIWSSFDVYYISSQEE
ncbi:hypothetical protein M422DRAFT_271436 [Sphaerobolus stellatus SS14]|uniref:Uncharacterized protein n=1 Tax=Sphaerobolus stellatus (strain SS14) TaxID=990650 RepID=A0A0C9TDS9_SPHS4|nr:hypothetical protein M422DRAFT_271436 [Sphaerobolus stellatus SS14]